MASFINRDTPFEIIQLLRKSPPTKKVIKLRTIRKQPQQLQQQSEMSGRASILSSDGGQSSSLRSEPQSDADDEQGAESTASIEDGRGGSVENIAIATTTGEDVKNLSDPEEDRVFSRLNKSMSLECDVPTAGLIDRAKLQRDLAEIEEIRSVTSASTSKADSPFLTAPSDQAVAVLATASQQHPTLLVSTSSEAAPITSSPVQETAPILSISNISSTSSSSAPASSAPTSKPSTTATSSPSRSPSKQSEENFFTSAFKKMNNLFQQPAAAAANSVPVSADSLASLNSSLSKNIPPSKTTLNTLSTSSTSMLPSSLSSSTTVAKASSKEDTTPSHTKKSSKHHHKKNKSTASVASFESNSSAGAGDSSDASPASNNQQPSLVISQKTKSKTHSSKKVAGSSSSSSASSTTAAAAVSKKQVTSPVMQSTEAIAGVHSSSGSKLLAAVGVAGDSGNNTTVSSKSATLLTSILDSNNSKSKKANTIGGSKLSSTAADPSIPTTTTTSALSGLAELAAAGSSLSLSRHSTPPPQLLGSEGVGPSTVASSPSQPHILVQGVLVAPVTAKELAQMPRGTGLGSRSDLSTTTDIGRRKSEKTSTSSRGQTKIPVATLLPPPSLPLCQCTSAQAVASMTCIMDTVFEGVTVNTLWGELFAYSACLAGDRSIGQESLFRLFLIETRKSKGEMGEIRGFGWQMMDLFLLKHSYA